MPFRGVVDPDDLAVLSRTFEEYCAENAIGPQHPDREQIAHRIMGLFIHGISTVDDLKRNLKNGKL